MRTRRQAVKRGKGGREKGREGTLEVFEESRLSSLSS